MPLGDTDVDGEGRAVITEFYLKKLSGRSETTGISADASSSKMFLFRCYELETFWHF